MDVSFFFANADELLESLIVQLASIQTHKKKSTSEIGVFLVFLLFNHG